MFVNFVTMIKAKTTLYGGFLFFIRKVHFEIHLKVPLVYHLNDACALKVNTLMHVYHHFCVVLHSVFSQPIESRHKLV